MNEGDGKTTTPKIIDVVPAPVANVPQASEVSIPFLTATDTSPVANAPQAPEVSMPFPTSTDTSSNKIVTDISDDEGPEYIGEGGFGLAQGTANTYVIAL